MTSGGYAAPRTLDEAVALLSKNPDARVLAGGSGLLVEPNRSRLADCLLVDLRRIQGLTGIERDSAGAVKIAAMTTLSATADHELIRTTYPTLAEAVLSTGDAQFRNRATIGGSLASTDPDADLPALALMLDAVIQMVGSKGSRSIRADEMFAGGHPTAPRSDEVITAVILPAPAARSGTAYEVLRSPATLSPICGVAASVTLGGDGAVAAARVALAGAAEHPCRMLSVEKALATNKRLTREAVTAAAASAGQGATFHGDVFASVEYRRHLARVLTERALAKALDRAAG
jgi:carbon-monoxide dehydrogenase medium subunit